MVTGSYDRRSSVCTAGADVASVPYAGGIGPDNQWRANDRVVLDVGDLGAEKAGTFSLPFSGRG